MSKHILDIFMVIGGMPFDGDTIKHSSLGGSETAALCVARELAALGHTVTVFAHLPANPGIFDGVHYAPVEMAMETVQKVPHDVLVVQRNPYLYAIRTAAKLNFLWNHDLATPEMAALHNATLWNVDGIFLLSDFHIEQYKHVYNFIPHKQYVKTRNGIDLDLFPQDAVKVPKKIMYGARPERGLFNLLHEGGIMDQLHELDPEIHLYLVGYYNPVDHYKDLYGYLNKRAEDLPNVTDLGCLPKAELYKHYAEAELYVYPTPHPGTQFAEISCITAMECMAAGTPFVTTAKGALPETLGDNTSAILHLETDDPSFGEHFSQTVWHLLNEGRQDMQQMAKNGRKRARNFSWKGVAKQWEKQFFKMFRKATKDQDRLIDHFLYHEDILVAQKLAEKHNKKDVSAEIQKQYGWCFDEKEHNAMYAEFAAEEYKDRPGEHVALHYDHVFQNEIRWRATQEWLQDFQILKGAKILDVGCGCGYFSVGLANLGYNVTGFDPAPEYVKQAKLLAEQRFQSEVGGFVEFFNAEQAGWAGEYDAIYIAEILEHLAYIEPQDFVKQFEPYLKDDGWFLITTPFGPLKRTAAKGSGHHHELHVRHLENGDIREIFGKKQDFNASVEYWQHTSSTHELCGWYFYSFKKGGEYGQQDFHRKVTLQNPRNRLSVCLITKNEEANLKKCLNSVYELADEIVVADTGSTDATIEIAKEYGARVVEGPNPLDLQHGFEAARNASIEPACGDWILWLDADEELQEPQNALKYLKTFSAYDAFRIRQHHFTCQPQGAYKVDKPCRLFRNNKGIKFFGLIHEHPETGINDGPGPCIELSDIDIAHSGYYTERARRKKFWRNLPLLAADREKYPDRVLGRYLGMRDYLHLAQHELEQNGNKPTNRAIAYCQEAVNIYQNWFLTIGGFMQYDGLEYYSAALHLLGMGQDYTYMIRINGGQPEQRQARFFNREDFMAFFNKLVEEQGGI